MLPVWEPTFTNRYAGSILQLLLWELHFLQLFYLIQDIDPIKAVTAPMIVAAIGIILSIVGIFMVRTKESATQKTY